MFSIGRPASVLVLETGTARSERLRCRLASLILMIIPLGDWPYQGHKSRCSIASCRPGGGAAGGITPGGWGVAGGGAGGLEPVLLA